MTPNFGVMPIFQEIDKEIVNLIRNCFKYTTFCKISKDCLSILELNADYVW
jgi:hypothetical protein